MFEFIIGIDPGQSGYICFYYPNNQRVRFAPIPLKNDGTKDVDFKAFEKLLREPVKRTFFLNTHVFLERAMPLAMGAKHAFNYGRGFAALEIALAQSGLPTTYVEPAKWVKTMHEGISKDLKPKAKSLIAVQRLFPNLVSKIPCSPKSKVPLDGAIDALLIAAWGQRQLQIANPSLTANDF